MEGPGPRSVCVVGVAGEAPSALAVALLLSAADVIPAYHILRGHGLCPSGRVGGVAGEGRVSIECASTPRFVLLSFSSSPSFFLFSRLPHRVCDVEVWSSVITGQMNGGRACTVVVRHERATYRTTLLCVRGLGGVVRMLRSVWRRPSVSCKEGGRAYSRSLFRLMP